MPRTGLQSIARNTALLTATQAVNTVTRFVYVVLLARLLGPDGYALMAYSQSWYLAFLPVALFGLGPALVHAVAGDPARAPAVAARALGIRMAATAISALACVLLAFVVAPDPLASVLISIMTVALAGRALNAWAQHLYALHETNQHALRQELAFRAIELVLAVLVLAGGGSLVTLATTHAAVWAAQAAWSVAVAMGGLRSRLPWAEAFRPAGWPPLARTAMPFFLNKLATDWRVYGTLVLYGNLAASAADFGQFALAMQALAIAWAAPVALLTAAQPALTRSAARGDDRDLRYAGAVQRAGFIGGAAAALAGMALGPALAVAVLGPAYAEAGRLLGLALWCLVPIVAGIAWPSVATARGDLRSPVIANLAGAAVTTVALPLLVPRLGGAGAIAAAALGFATTPAICFWLAVGRGWADWDRELARPAAVVAAALIAWLALADEHAVLALAASLVVLAAGAAFGGVVTPAERQSLVAWRARS